MSKKIIEQLISNMEKVIFGKTEEIRHVVATLLAGGHILIEDVPGVGKTYLARSLALSIGGEFKRIQFTPDLLPTDVTGVSIYNQKTKEFEFREGPVFANILLADELNRATPRTQSALLECMEERQVTSDGIPRFMPSPFFVIATQNPIEQQGVYHLPEAQLDRFMIRLSIGYPKHFIEMDILDAQKKQHPIETINSVCKMEDILHAHNIVRDIYVDESIREYIVSLVEATRAHESLILGGSPRASISLYRMSQAMAFINGADFVLPDVIKELAKPVLRHRLILKPQARLGGLTPDEVISDILQKIPVPIARVR
ncbi:MAG TPA: MoxR family ATPase [Candidatus Sumerlaeota bacterium]|nr:MAG: ATPase RavA [candidate division BRC1 bacterium ADurb.Bin183]HOE63547.1 MoxR family ATPase [Candidatus Sumerlaeota bacterium]HRR30564.1 MoxR family ATPase [Candidatus Sumerlaeia bacterium]HON51337.1 MoxR family ATPase [Candidatus Sumerlaeota bacterium]HOR64609.1 MoxR family ATPase [Candidatus Sumerlaeota bacterium]